MAKEQKTGSLRVVVEGLALWVPAKTESGQKIWRVLFPKKTGSNSQHEPRLSVCVDGKPYEELSAPVDLRGRTVTFRGVPASAPKAKARSSITAPSWLLALKGQPGSVARSQHAHESANVIATLTLPRGELQALNHHDKWIRHVHFGGADQAVDFASVVRFSRIERDTALQFFDKSDGESQDMVALPTATSDVSVVISNRILAEHHRQAQPTKPFELITETRDLLALTGQQVELPWYDGPPLKPIPFVADACARATVPEASPMYSVYRLCPQGYCEECGDE